MRWSLNASKSEVSEGQRVTTSVALPQAAAGVAMIPGDAREGLGIADPAETRTRGRCVGVRAESHRRKAWVAGSAAAFRVCSFIPSPCGGGEINVQHGGLDVSLTTQPIGRRARRGGLPRGGR